MTEMKKLLSLIVCLFGIQLYAQNPGDVNIIPVPVSMKLTGTSFTIDKNTSLSFDVSNEELRQLAAYFQLTINEISGIKPKNEEKKDNIISFAIVDDNRLGEEGYELVSGPSSVQIRANSGKGIFYGMQSLFQVLPSVRTNAPLLVPGMIIVDYPRFAWRGMHLDVSRHFFSPEMVKRYIDLLALYKMNTFHWHLVDDSGWRIEIKRYPKLTDVGAWRVDRNDKPWGSREPAKEGEAATYGGYYTQEQIKEIVKYAQLRNITIVPEIEMPGHSVAALAAYPELGCSGKPQFVNTGGRYPEGVQSSFCPGKEESFIFLQNVLEEVMALFPSTFIHVGGDEVDKSHWKNCEFCQQRKRAEKLKDENELQSYMIQRMERFLSSKGRRLIGWDEILEGGLAPGATVMSWRGEAGGIAAARMKHDVVMTPGHPCYFDHYQAGPEGEPLSIGGMNTLKNVYDYEPIPKELEKEYHKYVLGAQANIWTEYIQTADHLEYMLLPRLAALAEVVWSPSSIRDWEDFNRRLKGWHFRMYDFKGLRYGKGNTRVEIVPLSKDGRLYVSLKTEVIDGEIVYTLDGSMPSVNAARYHSPIEITTTSRLHASVVKDGAVLGLVPSTQDFTIHKASGSNVTYENPVSSYYMADGPNSITDGVRGTLRVNKYWHGFNGIDVIAIIDMGSEKEIGSLGVGFLQKQVDWIFLPSSVSFEISKDGRNYELVDLVANPLKAGDHGDKVVDYTKQFSKKKARYIKVTAINFGNCPKGHPGEGHPTWLFVDEVIVE